MDTTQIAVPAVVGAILTFLIPLILRQSWPRWARFAVSIGITVLVAAAVVAAWLRPESWEVVAGGLAAAVAVGQVVYGALKGTGIFDWISQTTDPKPTQGSTTQQIGA